MNHINYPAASNRVLSDHFTKSQNFFESDLLLKHFFKKHAASSAYDYFLSILQETGKSAALQMDELSLLADKNEPELVKRNAYGEQIDEIRFHPSYWSLMKIAVDSQMFRIKWEPSFKTQFGAQSHFLGFQAGYLYAMSEMGQYCPLCMTDGVARLIDKFCTQEDKTRLLPHIFTNNVEDFFTGAMFLTEKIGGSDVGKNLVIAEQVEGKRYNLYGEKWFCSNANADVIFALARTNTEVQGTRGLSIFMIEKTKKDGSKNFLNYVRLKEKLGVRSMASAECLLDGVEATLVGQEFEGFKIMTEMINLSRLYNSVAALSASRRALIEAYTFLKHRTTFGKNALQHALIRTKFEELAALNCAGFYLTFRAIRALDAADNGNEQEAELIRFLTPMTKKWTAENGVYITRESMELMGGIGYIEDLVMPKIMRDIMVLPIWEGAGNIMILDMLRALMKSKGYQVMYKEILTAFEKLTIHKLDISQELEELHQLILSLAKDSQDEMEVKAKYCFEKLTTFYQLATLLEETDEQSSAWTKPAINFFANQLLGLNDFSTIPSAAEIDAMVAWKI